MRFELHNVAAAAHLHGLRREARRQGRAGHHAGLHHHQREHAAGPDRPGDPPRALQGRRGPGGTAWRRAVHAAAGLRRLRPAHSAPASRAGRCASTTASTRTTRSSWARARSTRSRSSRPKAAASICSSASAPAPCRARTPACCGRCSARRSASRWKRRSPRQRRSDGTVGHPALAGGDEPEAGDMFAGIHGQAGHTVEA